MRSVRALLIGYFLIALVAGAPIISVMVAGSIASWNGCELHEGFRNPCIVNGTDIGDTLYTMGVLGWLMIATIPLGLAAVVAWTLIWYVVRRLTGRPVSPPAVRPPAPSPNPEV